MQIVLAPAAPYKLKKLNTIGLLVVLFGVVGGFLWAALTPLDSAVVAIGKVKVLTERKQIQHLEGGIVESILVKEGQRVQANQLLLILDETFASSERDRLWAQLQELQIRESILLAQRDMIAKPVFNAVIKEALSDNWVSAQMDSALNGFKINQGNLKGQLDILDNQSFQLSEQIKGIDSEKLAKKEQLGFMEEETASWKSLLEQQLTNKLRYLELQRGAAELRGEIAQLDSQAASLRAKFSEIDLKKISITQDYRKVAADELTDVKINLKDVSKRLDSAKNVLKRIEIRSPVDGVVVGLQVHTLGAVIKPGDVIMEMVPEKDELIVEARIKPVDVDKVFKSLESRIKMSSYKQHEFPEFNGVVDSVSADVFEDAKSGESFYTARIIIPESSLNMEQKNKILPGMPAEVLIKTGNSTPLQYLMEPIVSSFRKAWRDA